MKLKKKDQDQTSETADSKKKKSQDETQNQPEEERADEALGTEAASDNLSSDKSVATEEITAAEERADSGRMTVVGDELVPADEALAEREIGAGVEGRQHAVDRAVPGASVAGKGPVNQVGDVDAPQTRRPMESTPSDVHSRTLQGLTAKKDFSESVHNGALLNRRFSLKKGDDLSGIEDYFYDYLREHGVI